MTDRFFHRAAVFAAALSFCAVGLANAQSAADNETPQPRGNRLNQLDPAQREELLRRFREREGRGSLVEMVEKIRKPGESDEEAVRRLLQTRADMLAGRKSEVPGSVDKTLEHGGRTRRYVLHLPPNLEQLGRVPLVLCLHGTFGNAVIAEQRSMLSELSNREGFIAVYPEGVRGHWNDGRDQFAAGADDVGFIRELIRIIISGYPVDPKRVYATGMSNGAIMSYRLGAELTPELAGIAPVAGSIPAGGLPKPQGPLPVVIIHGTADPFVRWEGGEVPKAAGGTVLPVMEAARFWVKNNGCDPTPVETALPVLHPEDPTRVFKVEFKGGAAPVTVYRVERGGHAWPGGPEAVLESAGVTSTNLDASAAIWAFFKNHANPKK
jgi:polyhydroxybutyrate depolymerase